MTEAKSLSDECRWKMRNVIRRIIVEYFPASRSLLVVSGCSFQVKAGEIQGLLGKEFYEFKDLLPKARKNLEKKNL